MLRLVSKFEKYEAMGLVKLTDMPGKARFVVAAKNIRKELKQTFPGHKFSVTASSFSMGNEIIIECFDLAVSLEAVNEVVSKYEYGTFDGMTDTQGFIKTDFMDTYGGSKYITIQTGQ